MAHQASIDQLNFSHLSFQFGNTDAFLEDVDFAFPVDQNVVIRGLNGAGKSSVLRLLACLVIPTNGQYRINDVVVSDMSFEEFLPYRLSIGFGFDLGGMLSNRTIAENIMLPLVYHKIIPFHEAKARCEHYMKLFEVLDFQDQRPAHVTGRVRKIASIIRSIIMHPQILLLDDPTEGLSRSMLDTLLFVLHDLRAQGVLRHLFLTSNYEGFVQNLKCTEVLVQHKKLVLAQAVLSETGGICA